LSLFQIYLKMTKFIFGKIKNFQIQSTTISPDFLLKNLQFFLNISISVFYFFFVSLS